MPRSSYLRVEESSMSGEVHRLSDGTTTYMSADLAELSAQVAVDGDFDFTSPEVDEETLERMYNAGDWVMYPNVMKTGSFPGIDALRRCIGEGRRPYLVVNARHDFNDVILDKGIIPPSERHTRVQLGSYDTLKYLISGIGYKVGLRNLDRLPGWFLGLFHRHTSMLHEELISTCDRLPYRIVPRVQCAGGATHYVMPLYFPDRMREFMPLLEQHGLVELQPLENFRDFNLIDPKGKMPDGGLHVASNALDEYLPYFDALPLVGRPVVLVRGPDKRFAVSPAYCLDRGYAITAGIAAVVLVPEVGAPASPCIESLLRSYR